MPEVGREMKLWRNVLRKRRELKWNKRRRKKGELFRWVKWLRVKAICFHWDDRSGLVLDVLAAQRRSWKSTFPLSVISIHYISSWTVECLGNLESLLNPGDSKTNRFNKISAMTHKIFCWWCRETNMHVNNGHRQNCYFFAFWLVVKRQEQRQRIKKK